MHKFQIMKERKKKKNSHLTKAETVTSNCTMAMKFQVYTTVQLRSSIF